MLFDSTEDTAEDVPGPLDHVSYDGNTIRVFGANDDYSETGQGAADEIRSQVATKYDPEKFHRHACGVLSWFGRRAQLESLQIGVEDEDFEAACGVLHRRFVVGAVDRVLARLGSQAAEDLLIVGIGVGPVAVGVVSEVRTKRIAKKAAAQSGDMENDGKEKSDQ